MKIRIAGLQIFTQIGLYEWEKGRKSPLILNIEIEIKNNRVFETKSIKDTLDYDSISRVLVEKIGEREFDLIEEVCYFTAQIILQNSLVKRCKISVEKNYALPGAKGVSVEEEFENL
jgi:dihydroneopterin aldolase